jgi:hypothetical protein
MLNERLTEIAQPAGPTASSDNHVEDAADPVGALPTEVGVTSTDGPAMLPDRRRSSLHSCRLSGLGTARCRLQTASRDF